MGKIRTVLPAALVMGITWADEVICSEVLKKLENEYGSVELSSESFDFDSMTDYYRKEMGEGLQKKFICFSILIHPGQLPSIKIFTNSLELRHTSIAGETPQRTVNIDPGYVTLSKLVLASTKDYNHRIYLSDGIYGEVTLKFYGGGFHKTETTYPDYSTPSAIAFFNNTREYLKRNQSQWILSQG